MAQADQQMIEEIQDNFMSLAPLIGKKLIRHEYAFIDKEISRSHLEVLHVLGNCGTLPVTEICNKLHISKPNMTKILDGLVKEQLIKRTDNLKDRRVLNISLTDKGLAMQEKCMDMIKERMRQQLLPLGQEDIKIFARALEDIRQIITKLEDIK